MSVSTRFGYRHFDSSIRYDRERDKWIYRGRVFESYQAADEARDDERLWGDAYAADDERDNRRDEGR